MSETKKRLDDRTSGRIPVVAEFASDAGGDDTYAITLSPVPPAYEVGRIYSFLAPTANVGPASLNVNGLGAVTIKKFGSVDLDDGDIPANSIVDARYDGTNMQMLNTPATLASVPSSPAIVEVTGTTQSIAVNTIYIANNASQIVFTLPSTAAIGDFFKIIGKGAGGFKIAQNSGQTINDSYYTSTTGTSGFWLPAYPYDSVEISCVTADTVFTVDFRTNGSVDTALGWNDPMTLGNMPPIAGSSYSGAVSDDPRYTAYANNTTNGDLALWRGAMCDNQAASPFTHNTQARQLVGANTIKGSSFTPNTRPVIYQGYIYWGQHGDMFRALLTSNIQSGGNWTALTEASFPGGANGYLVGFAFGHFWFKSTTNANDFFRATISGTTFTYVDTITLSGSGSTSDPELNMVNERGIYVRRGTSSTDGNPDVVFANHAGVVDATNQCEDKIMAGTRFSAYSFIVSTGESVRKIVKVMS